MIQGVKVTTGARLHFGLLDVAAPFGGCGVMVDHPETIVEAEPSDQFRLVGEPDHIRQHTERVYGIAGRVASGVGGVATNGLPAVQVRLVQVAPSHTGLGSGTQLSMAVSEAILRALSLGSESGECLDEHVILDADRGLRSAVGTYGYFRGGFLAEGLAANTSDSLNALDVSLQLPDSWCAVVLLPCSSPQEKADSAFVSNTVSGLQEQQKFDQLPSTQAKRDALRSILVEQIVPAVECPDFGRFADSVTAYNRASGELFATVQGGAYNGPETTALIGKLLSDGQKGVGQSSWGPGVFVWFEEPGLAAEFCRGWSDPARTPLLVRPRPQGRAVAVYSRNRERS